MLLQTATATSGFGRMVHLPQQWLTMDTLALVRPPIRSRPHLLRVPIQSESGNSETNSRRI